MPRKPAVYLGLLSLCLLGQSRIPSAEDAPSLTSDLASFGFPVTGGTAPGYVDDAACALCHTDLAASYREKGMGRSFYRPRPETDIEDFSAPPFVHALSAQSMQIVRRDGQLLFRRWQTDAEGRPVHLFEQPVDWILGSGNHARTYLYRTAGGELYQLPLAWYGQTRSWGMAPGFDRPDHEGVLRRVRRECIFCHNSYPDMPAGSDAYEAPQAFPERLPEGIGCQRCHGPGAGHVGLALGGIGLRSELRASIFNPGRLPAPRRDEVCLGCHLQPSVALPGLRRFGRADFSFRPGEPISDYLVQIDIEEEGQPAAERFEINHHPYRLRQSLCWTESAGALTCLTCHDPHRKVPASYKAEHYRRACLTCHQEEACPEEAKKADDHGKAADCTSCHMPKRRTQDVVKVVMTDHRIQRQPGGPELLAPRAEREPVLTGVRLLEPGSAPGPLGEVYRAAAVVRAVRSEEAVRYLEKMLAAAQPAEIDPWLDLAEGQLRLRRFADAERTLAGVLARSPGHLQALEWLALARAGQGKADEAIALLQQLVATAPGRAEAEYNLGRLLFVNGRIAEAERHLQRALAARPNLVAAWFRLGEIRAAQGRQDEAVSCWRRALEIEPRHTESHKALEETLAAP